MGDIYKVEGISVSVVSPWYPIFVWIQVTSDVGKPNDEPPNGVRFSNMADQVFFFWINPKTLALNPKILAGPSDHPEVKYINYNPDRRCFW